MRLLYCDDSGNPNLTLYAFVEVEAKHWSGALNSWLSARKVLRDEYSIPVRRELHAVDFLSGRGNPSTDPLWNRNRSHRLQVGEFLLQTLTMMPIEFSCFYSTGNRRASTYASAIASINYRLHRANEQAIIMIDGDGTEPAYLDAHRALDSYDRHIVEDPWPQGSHASQWIMIADLVAYLSFHALTNTNQHLRSLYGKYLLPKDVYAGPHRVN